MEFPMHKAAEFGDLGKVKQSVREGMSIDIPDDSKYTPLHFAAKCGHLEVSEFLVSQKIDLDLKSEDGSTAVMVAAERGHKSIVQLLLRAGADVKGCSLLGNWTLLHHVCLVGWTDIVKLLVEDSNTDLNAKTTLRITPMLLAASEGLVDIVEVIIKAGGDIDCKDIDGWCVLHYASKKGWLHIVRQIIETKTSTIDAVTDNSMTPVQLAASEGHKDVVEFLIDAGADLDFRYEAVPWWIDGGPNSPRWTVLHYACKRGWLQIVKKIVRIKKSCINDLLYKNGNTPLHIAIGMHHTEIVKELLKAGADVKIQNYHDDCAFGWESIHEAASNGNLEKVQYLLKLGVPIDARDRGNCTLLHCAAEDNQLEVAEFLIRNNCDLNPINDGGDTPILTAAICGNDKFINLLVRSGADVNPDPQGWFWNCCSQLYKYTVLHRACKNNWKDTVECILQNAKVNIDGKSIDDKTPLMCAAEHASCEIARLLLQAGANVNAVDRVGKTALHYACEYENAELVKLLMRAGADVNFQNSDNETPLHYAVVAENPEVIKILIQHGAYLKYSDENTISQNNPLRELVLKDVDLCARLIINKFNHQSLPLIYKTPEYAKRLPPMDKLCIGNTDGVTSGIEVCVESEMETNTFCNVMKMKPTVLTLMCVEALINPRPIKESQGQIKSKKRSAQKVTGPVKRSARLAALNTPLAKKSSN